MNERLQEIIDNWNWSVFIFEALAKAVGVLTGVALSWFLLFRRRLKALEKLQRGDSDDVLFQAHYFYPLSPSDGSTDASRVQLLFRNVAEKRTILQLYDNPAAAELVRKLGDETTLNQPILPTLGTIGFEVLNDAAGWISGSVATSPIPRSVWLFCLTCEDRYAVRKRCVRGFLIKEADLRKFHDWDWCRNKVSVERPWHWFRIVALHRIARLYADQQRIHSGMSEPNAMPLVDDQVKHRRILPLSLGLIDGESPISDPLLPDWATLLASLQAKGLTLERGAWPSDLT
jgi:hypothetical protein